MREEDLHKLIVQWLQCACALVGAVMQQRVLWQRTLQPLDDQVSERQGDRHSD